MYLTTEYSLQFAVQMVTAGECLVSRFRERAPTVEEITDYDRKCFKLYIMLIDAHDAGVSWDDSYPHLFDEPIGADRQWAESRHRSHLNRAHWMTAAGYRQLI